MSKDAFNLMSAFIHAQGFEHEIDRVIDGETFYIVTKIKKEKSKKEVLENDEFNEFYNNYKKKVCRPLALKEFLKLTKTERILMLNDYKARFEHTEKQYVPKPHNYIKNREFMDERIKQTGSKSSGSDVKSKLQHIARDHANSSESRYSFSRNDT